jgi:hypothetical protein
MTSVVKFIETFDMATGSVSARSVIYAWSTHSGQRLTVGQSCRRLILPHSRDEGRPTPPLNAVEDCAYTMAASRR